VEPQPFQVHTGCRAPARTHRLGQLIQIRTAPRASTYTSATVNHNHLELAGAELGMQHTGRRVVGTGCNYASDPGSAGGQDARGPKPG
jgi:hypothetical protein